MATCEQEYSLITRLKYIKNFFSLILTYCTSFGSIKYTEFKFMLSFYGFVVNSDDFDP